MENQSVTAIGYIKFMLVFFTLAMLWVAYENYTIKKERKISNCIDAARTTDCILL